MGKTGSVDQGCEPVSYENPYLLGHRYEGIDPAEVLVVQTEKDLKKARLESEGLKGWQAQLRPMQH